jgi:glycosyltransferase involved in cell wall biosynthesis
MISTHSSNAAPDISVVLTCYNFRHYLAAAVQSLLSQQTQYTLELIVIDDASPDRSFEAISAIQDERLILIVHAVNQGAAASINEGMALARGRFVARFDGDDVWLPSAMQKLAQALDQNPSAVLAYGDIATIDANHQVAAMSSNRLPGPVLRREFELLLSEHYTCAPAMLARRSSWEKLLPWPERFKSGLGDWYFNLKMAQLGDFVYVPEVLAHYRVHRDGMHYQFVRDRVGETNARAILSELLPLADPRRLPVPAAKIFAQHLANFAANYFAAGMDADARRVYLEILRRSPMLLFKRQQFFVALGALTLGKHRYDRCKQWLRSWFARTSSKHDPRT